MPGLIWIDKSSRLDKLSRRPVLTLGHAGAGLGSGGAVKGRVGEVDVFRVHLFLAQPQTLAEAINLSKCHQTLVPQEKDSDMAGASARSVSCQEMGSEGIYISL